jgi:hypothetical protein
MTERIAAVLDQIEAQQQQQQSSMIPDDIPLEEIADRVVRGKLKLSPPQMRLLIELLPYYRPKLTAVSVGVMDGDSFAAQLDRAIERNQRQQMKLIEAQPVQPHPASELKGRMARLRRRV